MKRIFLARHGETFQNRNKTVQGSDPTQGRLTESGKLQAQLLGRALAERPIEIVFCSPLERAVLTMSQILLARKGERTLPIVFADQLKEINLAGLHGRSHTEWKAAINGDPMSYKPPGGESWQDVQQRSRAYFRETVLASPHQEILIVAHGGVNRGIISSLLDLTMAEAWEGPGAGIPQDPSCLNHLHFNGKGELSRVVVNDTNHLAEEFPTAGPGQIWMAKERKWELPKSAPSWF